TMMPHARRSRRPSIALGAALALVACRSHHDVSRPIHPDAAPPPPPTTATSELPPLGGDWLVHLPLDGFGPSAVSVPLGTTSPRPIVVGVHARNDRGEWACGEWRGVTEARPFILCPHGVPVDAPPAAGLVFAGAERTRHEIDAGLDALRARFGRYVAEGPIILAGISLGAILGVQIVSSDPARFPIAVLDEGGWEEWTPARVAAFAKGGGKRVLFVCSTAFCEN